VAAAASVNFGWRGSIDKLGILKHFRHFLTHNYDKNMGPGGGGG